MKIKAILVILLITTSIVACAPAVTVHPHTDNFAFVLQDFSCGSIPVNILDTANGTLVYTPFGDTTSTTISLRLTGDELESIYQKAISIDFFDYPSEFVVPDDQVRGYQMPSSSYQLSMTNGEMTNSVSWRDDTITKSSYTKADQLRELMNLIDEIIQSYPEVQQLPGPKELCL
jgi:hypothetical protein